MASWQLNRCITCNEAFPLNSELASIPDAKKIAFDSAMSRVWRICDSCGAWNLLGVEASQRAIPELTLRFATGKINQYVALSVSRVGSHLELTQLHPNVDRSKALDAGSGHLRRDDIATSIRRKELDKSSSLVLLGNLFSLLLLLIMSVGLKYDKLLALGFQVLMLIPLGLIITYALLFGMRHGIHFMTSRLHPDSGFRLPQATVLRTPTGYNKHLRRMHHTTSMSLLLLVYNVLVYVATGSRHAMWLVTSVTVLPILVIGIVFAVFGLLKKRIMVPIVYCDRSGNSRRCLAQDTGHIAIDWSADFGELRVYGLTNVAVLKGAEANSTIRQGLLWFHGILKPDAEETIAAVELLRAVGGLSGVLHALSGFKDDNSGRVKLFELPATYRVALDLALAAPDRAPPDVYRRELAAEDAGEIAAVAEQLDSET